MLANIVDKREGKICTNFLLIILSIIPIINLAIAVFAVYYLLSKHQIFKNIYIYIDSKLLGYQNIIEQLIYGNNK